MLIRINISDFQDIEDDKDFFTKLLCEESISCLPASVNNLFEFIKLNRLFIFYRYLVLIISFVLYLQHQWKKLKKHVNEYLNFVDDMQNLFLNKFVDFSFF